MECTKEIWPTNEEYLWAFSLKVKNLRIPFSGSLDLTHRCNLRCVHCYLGGRSSLFKKKEMSTNQVLSVIDDITDAGCLSLLISGGEPLLQPDSCFEIFGFCREEKISTALDTAGNVEWSSFQRLLSVTDYILYDIKTLDENVHYNKCGVTNRIILENLKKLLNSNVNLIIRIPVIPGINDNVNDVKAIAGTLSRSSSRRPQKH